MSDWFAYRAIAVEIVAVAVTLVALEAHRWSSPSNIALVLESTWHSMMLMMDRVRPMFAVVDCNRSVCPAIGISLVIADSVTYRRFDAYQGTWMLGCRCRMHSIVSTEYLSNPYLGRAIHVIDHRIGCDDGLLATAIELLGFVEYNVID